MESGQGLALIWRMIVQQLRRALLAALVLGLNVRMVSFLLKSPQQKMALCFTSDSLASDQEKEVPILRGEKADLPLFPF